MTQSYLVCAVVVGRERSWAAARVGRRTLCRVTVRVVAKRADSPGATRTAVRGSALGLKCRNTCLGDQGEDACSCNCPLAGLE